MSIVGLLLIVIGWGIQVFNSSKEKKQIQPYFLVLYILGAVLLVADGMFAAWTANGIAGLVNGLSLVTFLNILAAFLAVVVLMKIRD